MSWLPTVVTVAPASEPVSLAEARSQCRIDGSDSDGDLNRYIIAARALTEEYTGTKLVSQTVLMQASRFCDLIDLPVAPIISVSSVKYLDTAGAEQTLDTSVYELVNTGLEPQIRLKINQVWPSVRQCVSDAVRVTAIAGYSTVPESIRAAMLMLIAQWNDERSSISSVRQSVTSDGGIPTLPNTVDALLANYRRF
jgi:uncharacterized phiE125 gp8 family phage protein